MALGTVFSTVPQNQQELLSLRGTTQLHSARRAMVEGEKGQTRGQERRGECAAHLLILLLLQGWVLRLVQQDSCWERLLAPSSSTTHSLGFLLLLLCRLFFRLPLFPFFPFLLLVRPCRLWLHTEMVRARDPRDHATGGGRTPLTHPQQLHDELPVLLILVLVLLLHLLHFTLQKKTHQQL